MKSIKKRIRLMLVSLLLIILVSISFSFAYIRGGSKYNESVSTVALTGGNIRINYSNKSGDIIASDIVPGFELIKKFSVTSDFNGKDYYTYGLWYTVALIIDKNDFDDNSIQYSLTLDNSSSKEGIQIGNKDDVGIPKGPNLNGIVIGSGKIENNNITHAYNLKISYPYRHADQTHEIGCEFNAHISVINTGFVNLTFDLNGGEFANLNLNSDSTMKVASNSIIDLPTPRYVSHVFNGWEKIGDNCNIDNNVLTTQGSDITLKALWIPLDTYEYDYTGGEQTFIANYSGYYKIETWGAQGGKGMKDGKLIYDGGYGGYSVGVINLSNDLLYINVGGKGANAQDKKTGGAGGYNGGGAGGNDANYNSSGGNEPGAGGGGATHIARISGMLSLVDDPNLLIIVSGGGGGGAYYGAGGAGGGAAGHYGYDSSTVIGTQTSGNAFGTGGAGAYKNAGGGGGGGGFYGGGGGQTSGYSGGGGSGYIGNTNLNNKFMYCHNCGISELDNSKTYITTCANEIPIENCAKIGNGYARITYLHA